MIHPQSAFGNSGHYYSDQATSDPPLFGCESTEESEVLRSLLFSHDGNLRQRVEQAFKQWNNTLREHLRAEMALKLSAGDDAQSVPVKVVDGLPDPLAAVFQGHPPELWRFLLRMPLMEATHIGLGFTAEYYQELWRAVAYEQSPESLPGLEQIHHVRDGFGRILEFLSGSNIDGEIRAINQDVLGAYFIHFRSVSLYWMAIGLISARLGVSVEALTVVVTTHELAHAYSHVGRDISGHKWDTSKFAAVDLHIAEGLAQFYTEVICRKIEPRFPGALQAYERLLGFQAPPYHAHLEWTEHARLKRAGEIIRASMIEARVRGVTHRAEFMDCILRHRGLVG